MNQETEKLRSYLLGELPETLSKEIDLRIMSDESFGKEIDMAEDELMEEYLDGSLSPATVLAFHDNFLISDERQKSLHHLRLIKNYAKNCQVERDKQTHRELFFTFRTFAEIYRRHVRLLTISAAVILICITTAITWWLIADSRPSKNPLAELNERNVTNTTNLPGVSHINLVSDSFRGNSSQNILTKNSDGQFLFHLALPPSINGADEFQLLITKDGQQIFSPIKVSSYTNRDGKEVRVLVEAVWLPPGDYRILVTSRQPQTAPLNYPFKVE